MIYKRLVPLALAVLLLIPATVQGQTRGSQYAKGARTEVWSLTIPEGDSISYYFIIPEDVESITVCIDTFSTAGGIALEAAMDSSTVSTQFILTDFRPLKTVAAVLDSIASTTGGFVIDLTSRLQGYMAARFHIGYNATVSTAEEETIWVLIRRRR